MLIIETDEFKKDLKELPQDAVKIFLKQKIIFEENWLDARLHAKRLKDIKGVFSFRITRRYRTLFYFQNKQAVFFKIGHRKDIYD